MFQWFIFKINIRYWTRKKCEIFNKYYIVWIEISLAKVCYVLQIKEIKNQIRKDTHIKMLIWQNLIKSTTKRENLLGEEDIHFAYETLRWTSRSRPGFALYLEQCIPIEDYLKEKEWNSYIIIIK